MPPAHIRQFLQPALDVDGRRVRGSKNELNCHNIVLRRLCPCPSVWVGDKCLLVKGQHLTVRNIDGEQAPPEIGVLGSNHRNFRNYEPDAVVNSGPPIRDDAIAAPNPVIVVEALSPGTRGVDTGAKLDGYFRVPSIIHYLIVLRAKRGVIHHRRAPDGDIDTRIVSSGRIALDPPGIALDSDEIYGR